MTGSRKSGVLDKIVPALILSALLFAGCVSHIDEEGCPCPCGPGWACCDTKEICIREGDVCLNEDQKFLVELEGTWIGTADDVSTVNGSNRIVIDIVLLPDGIPNLEGLNGTLRFGEDVEPPVVDPDDPGVGLYDEESLFDGFVFDILNPAIVDNRLLIEFKPVSQWVGFCEAQTVIYTVMAGVYSCIPPWPGPCTDYVCTLENPEGGELQVKISKMDLCTYVCKCDEFSCTLHENEHLNQRLDLTVDIDNGTMIGTGDLGRIEAVRQ